MQGLLVTILLCFAASPCLCTRITAQDNPVYNVLDYGAKGDGQTDDTQAFVKAWNDVCNKSQSTPTFLIPQGKTFMLQPLLFNGPCKASTINFQVQGNITAPRSVDAWKWQGSASDYKGSWIQYAYIDGLAIEGGGLIDGQGAPWWDCFNKSKCERPIALNFFNCQNLQLKNLTQINSPGGHIKIFACNGTSMSNLHIIAPKDSPNTDGIDISHSSNIVIQQSNIETGDDCIAILGESSFINITGIYCGPGHGISIGSLGGGGIYAPVEEIHVKNCTFTGTSNGARIKTWEGGSGYARKITYEDIILEAAQNPVLIEQNYGSHVLNDQAVKVSDITFRNFQGTSAVDSAVQLICDKTIACTNIVLDQIHITSSDPGKKTNATCVNAHGTSSSSNVPQVSCLLK